MPAADFAAAQERIAARRAQRAANARTHAESSTSTPSPSPSRALTRLPFPFNRLSTAGLSAWDAVKGREGTRPEFRVGQVDAELLDDELLELLKGQVGEGLKYYGTHITDTYSAEILLALRAVLNDARKAGLEVEVLDVRPRWRQLVARVIQGKDDPL